MTEQDSYYDWGTPIPLSSVECPRTKDMIAAIKKRDYAKLESTRKKDDDEAVIFDIRTYVPQRPAADIRKQERLCVVFSADTSKTPRVLALRKDFPSQLSHLNLTGSCEPKCLCWFDGDFRDISPYLTQEMLLERLYLWLCRAASGELHLPSQPLEPFFLTTATLMYDPKEFSHPQEERTVYDINPLSAKGLFELAAASSKNMNESRRKSFVTLSLSCDPQATGVINEIPSNLQQLAGLLRNVGLDIIETLRSATRGIAVGPNREKLMECYWLVRILVPKTRSEGAVPESSESWVFWLDECVATLGCHLGVLQKHNGSYGALIKSIDPQKLDEIRIHLFKPVEVFNRSLARLMAGGNTSEYPQSILAVGVGALGSQIILNQARQGLGKWIMIDEDVFLPHNSSRHALSSLDKGRSKAEAMAIEIGSLLNDTSAAEGLSTDALKIDSEDPKLGRVKECEQIYDFSISRSVSSHLARLPLSAPRSSAFLAGRDHSLVVLSEGAERSARLDDLEFQLAFAATRNPTLEHLYVYPDDDTSIRYSRGCRDVSTILAQDVVATHAGVASQFLRNNIRAVDPTVNVWRLSQGELSIERIQVPACPVASVEVNGWEVRISAYATDEMHRSRSEKLPKETGGVLIGAFDVSSRIIYIAGVLASPPDSEEWPKSYVRGVKGLSQQLGEIKRKSASQLCYVGEWHTHPNGYSSAPSPADKKAHRSKVARMSEFGLPGVVAVLGESLEPSYLVDKM